MHVWCLHITVWVWRSMAPPREVRGKRQVSWSISDYLIASRKGLPRNQKFSVLYGLTGQKTLEGPLSLPSSVSGLQACIALPDFHMCAEDSNSSPHTCQASTPQWIISPAPGLSVCTLLAFSLDRIIFHSKFLLRCRFRFITRFRVVIKIGHPCLHGVSHWQHPCPEW